MSNWVLEERETEDSWSTVWAGDLEYILGMLRGAKHATQNPDRYRLRNPEGQIVPPYEAEELHDDTVSHLAHQISKLSKELKDAKETLRLRDAFYWPWPRAGNEDPRLPCPRFEFTYEQSEGDWSCLLWFVHRHVIGGQEAVCLSRTRTSARGMPWDTPQKEFLWLPYRDLACACHNANEFGLRLFAVHEEHVFELTLDSKNPIQQVAIP